MSTSFGVKTGGWKDISPGTLVGKFTEWKPVFGGAGLGIKGTVI